MKTLLLNVCLMLGSFSLIGQSTDDETGLPGDQFSLEGALELFKEANSPEDFEKALNTADYHVNNLDLNDDGETDYIHVNGSNDGDLRLFVLQVSVSENEKQDIAVIEIEKIGTDNAVIQIVGDEDIFGEETIIEPSEENDQDKEDHKRGPAVDEEAFIVVNVWAWPSIRFVYGPNYRPWVSPWRWRVYPNWWRPWRPLSWAVWHPFKVKHYRPTIRVVHTHRIVKAHNIYRPSRVTSTTVKSRYTSAHNNYKVTRSKTKVAGPRGNSVTKKSTTVQGRHGQVKGQKTTVKRSRRG